MRGRIDMKPEIRAIRLVETLGYSKALSLARRNRENSNGWFNYHKWDKVFNNIKQHDSKGL